MKNPNQTIPEYWSKDLKVTGRATKRNRPNLRQLWLFAKAQLLRRTKPSLLKQYRDIEPIKKQLSSVGFEVMDEKVDEQAFRDYCRNFEPVYDKIDYFKHRRNDYFYEKLMEHFLAIKYLDLSEDDIYVDIGAWGSPVADIVRDKFNCQAYCQDLIFEKGIHENIIGSPAEKLPVPDNTFTKMALHCAIDNFEGDSDIRFFQEAARVLKKGGLCVIAPFYVINVLENMINPFSQPPLPVLDKGARVIYGRGSVRFNRHYSPEDAYKRIDPVKNNFNTKVICTNDLTYINKTCRLRFVLRLEKK